MERAGRAVGARPHQEIRFCATPDGLGTAWARHGTGPPLVKVANWLTHLEYDWESPVWRYWLEGLGRSHPVIRYDERGCGLSDRETGVLSVDTWLSDLEAVVDAAGVERFSLLGISQGAAIAVAYAGRNHRGQRALGETLVGAIRAGWDEPNAAYRRLFTMRFLPEGTPEQMDWYDELQRRTTSGEIAARLYEAWSDVDVSDLARQVEAETLVAHCRGDAAVPFSQGPAARLPDPPGAAAAPGLDQPPAAPRRRRLAGVPGGAARVYRRPGRPDGGAGGGPQRARARGDVARGPGAEQRGDRRPTFPECPHGRAASLERLRQVARVGQGGSGRGGGVLLAGRLTSVGVCVQAAIRSRADCVVAPMRGARGVRTVSAHADRPPPAPRADPVPGPLRGAVRVSRTNPDAAGAGARPRRLDRNRRCPAHRF